MLLTKTTPKYLYRLATSLLAAAFLGYATGALPYYPQDWRWLICLAVLGLWLFKPSGGMALALIALIIPIAYQSLALALLYLIWLFFVVPTGPFGFLLLALTSILVFYPPASLLLLCLPLMAATLGARRGAFLAAITCFWAEALALLTGQATVGLLPLGVPSAPLITLRAAPLNPLSDFSWLLFGVENPASASVTTPVSHPFAFIPQLFTHPMLLAQIALWAIAAALVALLLSRARTNTWKERILPVSSGVLLLIIGYLSLPALLGGASADPGTILIGALLAGVTLVFGAPVWRAIARQLGASSSDKESGKGSSRKEIPTDAWDDLAGIDDLKKELMQVLQSQFDSQERASWEKMGLQPIRGILLYGPPGTGKTKLARILAHEAKASFFAVSGTEFTSKWFGESEANLRAIFEEAKSHRPAILFFDELEAFLPKRSDMARSDAPEKGLVATFLGYTDGVASLEGVLLVGATNHPDLIDPAAVRPGRFDKIIYLSPPDLNARRQILERFLRDKPLAAEVNLEIIAQRTERFTGTDLHALVTAVIQKALQRSGRKLKAITLADFETALLGLKPTVTFKMLKEYEALADQFSRRSEKAGKVEVVFKPSMTWDDVAGLSTVKDALREAIEMPLAHPEILQQYRVKPPKGILLFGPPGCGKTFLAKVVASEAKAHFLHVKGPELLQQYTGQSEAHLRELFMRARENAPCVLFFDELDALAAARGTQEAAGKILTQFLTEMDGFEELRGVIVVAATNRPDTLDPALLRPGRFDRLIYVPPPDEAARITLFQKELAEKPLDKNLEVYSLAQMTAGYSAADLAAICNTVALASAKETLRTGATQPITLNQLREAIQKTPRSISPAQLEFYETLREQLQR